MAAISSMIGLGLAAGSLGYGIYNKMEAQGEMSSANAMKTQAYMQQAGIAKNQSGLSKEQAAASEEWARLNFNLEAQNADYSRQAAAQSQTLRNNIIGSEMEIQAQRKQAMELDARRKQTEIIRQQQRARALALTNANAQGASRGTGLQGGYGQIAGQTGNNILGVQQNLQIGRDIYAQTQNISQNRIAMSDLETLFAGQRADLQTQKAQMVYDYARINAGFQTRSADLQSQMSTAQGYINYAQGGLEAANSKSNLGNTFIGMAPSLFGMGMTASNLFATSNQPMELQGFAGYSPVGTTYGPSFGNGLLPGIY